MLLGLCVWALFSQAVGLKPCGPSLVKNFGAGAYIEIPSQATSFTINVSIYSGSTRGFQGGSSFNGGIGSVSLVNDNSRSLTFLVEFPNPFTTSIISEVKFNNRHLCHTRVPLHGSTSKLVYTATRQGYGFPIYPSSETIDNDGENVIPSPGGFEKNNQDNININSRDFSLARNRTVNFWANGGRYSTTTEIPNARAENKKEECGVTISPKGLVFGGTAVLKGEWPWLAALIQKENMNFFCGSTIISTKHIITAAHCMFPKNRKQIDAKSFVVGVGKHNISDVYDGQFKEIRKVIIHEQFDSTTFLNDIVLLVLTDPLQYSRYIQPICMWPEHVSTLNDVTGSNATVVGWGRTENKRNEASETPLMVTVPVVDSKECRESHVASIENFDPNKEICAGAKNGKGPCDGDSGGALAVQLYTSGGSVSRWYLRGIVSYSLKGLENICDLDNYNVYTDTAKYAEWIGKAMDQL